MTTDVWIVIIEDRHADADAIPYSTEAGAAAAALAWAQEYARSPGDVAGAGLTQGMRNDGWVLYLPYGPEGDCVRVVKRQLDGNGG